MPRRHVRQRRTHRRKQEHVGGETPVTSNTGRKSTHPTETPAIDPLDGRWFDCPSAGAAVGTGYRVIVNAIQRGDLAYSRFGRKIRIHETDLRAWAEAQRIEAKPKA